MIAAFIPLSAARSAVLAIAMAAGGALVAADIAPEIPANPGQPGSTGTVRLIIGPAAYTVDERYRTTAPGVAPIDGSARTRADGRRAAIQAVSPLDPESDHGWVYGGELGFGHTAWSRAGAAISLRLITLDALFGYSGRIVHGLRWEATPFAGMGIARWQESDPGQSIPTTRALYVEAGLRAGISYTWDFGLQLALEARATAASSRPWMSRQDGTGATSTVHENARLHSGAVLGGLGWAF